MSYTPNVVQPLAFNGVLTKLQHNRSAVIQAVGDSTVYGLGATAPWTALLADKLGSYFDATVRMCTWDDTFQWYNGPSLRRTSSQGERTVPGTAFPQFLGPVQAVTGDFELTINFAPVTAWTGSSQNLIYKWAGGQLGILLSLGTTGLLTLFWSEDGTTSKSSVSTAAVPFTGTNAGWVRATLQVNNGSSGRSVKFYTGTDGVGWTQLGTTVTSTPVTSVFANNGRIWELGSGNWGWAQVRNAVAGGVDIVPIFPDAWQRGSSVTVSGGPTILLMNAAIAAKDVVWADDPTRRPKLLSVTTPDVIIIGIGINDTLAQPFKTYTDRFITMVRHFKALRPGVPIVVTTENPTPTSVKVAERLAETARIMAAEPGVTVLDTWQAYTDVSTQLQGDQVHPTDAGHRAHCDWVLRRLAPAIV